MNKAQTTLSADTKERPGDGTITTKTNQDGSTTILCNGLNNVHIGVTSAGLFRANGGVIQSPSVAKGRTAATTMDRVIVIQNSDGVRIGDSVSWNFTVGGKNKKSQEKAKRKELAEEPKIKEPVENAEVPSQSRMSP